MILIQSYSSPSEMSLDNEIYNRLKNKLKSLKLLYKKSEVSKVLSTSEFLPLSLRANFIKDEDNLIIGWGADACLYAWLLGKIFFKRKNYLSQNLIIRENSRHSGVNKIIQRLRFNLYKRALQSKNFFVTVNSAALIPYYTERFKCDASKFFVVYDHMTLSPKDLKEKSIHKNGVENSYIFCGGKAARDVESFTKIVKMMPDLHFKCVFPESYITEEMRELPNLECFSNLTRDEFNEILNGSQICFIPLNSKAPSGLTVILHAVLMGIPIVSTDIPSMREVIPSDEYGFLTPMRDIEGMVEAIKKLTNSDEIRNEVTEKAKEHAQIFSPESVSESLAKTIMGLVNPKSQDSIRP